MTKKEVGKSVDPFEETCASIISGVITFFMMLLVVVFPLIYHNSYFDILETKYQCFYICVLAMAGIGLVLALVMMIVDFNEFQGQHTKKMFSAFLPENLKKNFSLIDLAVAVFWVVCLISTLQSEYLYESVWGNEGRFSGFFLITIYVFFYFFVSKCWKVKNWILELFLISGMIICIIGITDYFQMDILGFRRSIKVDQSTIFTSTLGNINTYTAYVCMIMAFAAGRMIRSERFIDSLRYFVFLEASFMAIVMGCSDNAYLAIGALFAFLPFILFDSKRGILQYLIILSGFATVIQAIDYINQAYADSVIGLDSLFGVLVKAGALLYIVTAMWGITALFYCLIYRKKNIPTAPVGMEDEFGHKAVYGWCGIVIFGIAVVLMMLIDVNVMGHQSRYGSLSGYLVLGDSWGTNRGYIWRKSIELYREFPMMHKLFGYGPDTFGIMTVNEFKFDMIDATGQVFDNAHNEYLQFLLTIGPVGLFAYIAFLGLSFHKMIKNYLQNPCVLGCACAVLCYAFQATVNLNLPIATPMMWILLSAGVAATRTNAE